MGSHQRGLFALARYCLDIFLTTQNALFVMYYLCSHPLVQREEFNQLTTFCFSPLNGRSQRFKHWLEDMPNLLDLAKSALDMRGFGEHIVYSLCFLDSLTVNVCKERNMEQETPASLLSITKLPRFNLAQVCLYVLPRHQCCRVDMPLDSVQFTK